MPKKKRKAKVTRTQILAEVKKLRETNEKLELGLKKVEEELKSNPFGEPPFWNCPTNS
jgi:hypothetical protein